MTDNSKVTGGQWLALILSVVGFLGACACAIVWAFDQSRMFGCLVLSLACIACGWAMMGVLKDTAP